MTPKEKGHEILNMFYEFDKFFTLNRGNLLEFKRAKERALICVDIILEAVTTIADKKYDFYTEVKQEIKKL